MFQRTKKKKKPLKRMQCFIFKIFESHSSEDLKYLKALALIFFLSRGDKPLKGKLGLGNGSL